MTVPAIDDLPTPPQPQDDKPTFNTRMFAWIIAIQAWTTAVNAVSAAMNALYTTIAGLVTTATTAATNASNSATASANSATASAASAGASLWVSGTTYTNGQRVVSTLNGQLYRRSGSTGAGTTDPRDDTANYARVFAEPEMVTAESYFF